MNVFLIHVDQIPDVVYLNSNNRFASVYHNMKDNLLVYLVSYLKILVILRRVVQILNVLF